MKFDEYTAIKEISEGKKLNEFQAESYEWNEGKFPTIWPTRLMVLAALTYHGADAYLEIPEHCWTARAAKMAVRANYRAIKRIPDPYKNSCAVEFVSHYLIQTRAELKDYYQVLQEQPEMFQLACGRLNPGLSKNPQAYQSRRTKNMSRSMPLPPMVGGNFGLNFAGDEEYSDQDELTPENFLTMPVEKQSKDRLVRLLELDVDFPPDFIKRLSIPNRNAAYYRSLGEMAAAVFWEKKIIPYLNREVCERIAFAHPEASLETPAYLSKEGVKNFWDRKKESCTDRELTQWFLKFPLEVLDESMREDLYVTNQVLKKAPAIFLGSDEARRYLMQHPNDVLRLPEYQTPGILLLDGVHLTPQTLGLIANERFREKVRLALRIG